MYRRFVFIFVALIVAGFSYRWAFSATTVQQQRRAVLQVPAARMQKARIAIAAENEAGTSSNDLSDTENNSDDSPPLRAELAGFSDRYIAAMKGQTYSSQSNLLQQMQANIRVIQQKIPQSEQAEIIQWDLLSAGISFLRNITEFQLSHCEDYKREFRLRFAPRMNEDDDLDSGISKSYELLDAVCK